VKKEAGLKVKPLKQLVEAKKKTTKDNSGKHSKK
jgi:hypothetical protein